MRATLRSPQRIEFLAGILVTAIESGSYGSWMCVHRYHIPDDNEAEWYADLHVAEDEREDEGNPELIHVDLDMIARGLGVIRSAVLRETPRETRTLADGTEYTVGGETVLHNAKSGERLYLSEAHRKAIMLADRTNHEDGDLDVIDCLAILECALFGAVTYA